MGLGKLVQMVPTYLGSLTSRVASAQAKVQILHETHKRITIFRNSASYVTENKIQEHECTSICIVFYSSLKIFAGKRGFLLQRKNDIFSQSFGNLATLRFVR